MQFITLHFKSCLKIVGKKCSLQISAFYTFPHMWWKEAWAMMKHFGTHTTLLQCCCYVAGKKVYIQKGLTVANWKVDDWLKCYFMSRILSLTRPKLIFSTRPWTLISKVIVWNYTLLPTVGLRADRAMEVRDIVCS